MIKLKNYNTENAIRDRIDCNLSRKIAGAEDIKSIIKTRCIVTAEEHNFLGGLGESISRVITKNDPIPQEFIATNDTFGESGSPSKLMDKYGLNSNAIVNGVEKVLSRK